MTLRGMRIGRAVLAAFAACVALAARTQAQTGGGAADILRRGKIHGGAKPPRGFYDIAGRGPGAFEFRHGWLDRARAVRQNRQALRARGAFNLMNASSSVAALSATSPLAATAVGGTLRYPTLMPFFVNTTVGDSTIMDSAQVQNLFWGTAAAPPYSITTYYREISGNRLTVTGSVIRRGFRMVQSDTFYAGGVGCQGLCQSSRVDSLIREILHHADSTVDFSKFADSASRRVPAVVVLDPQVGGECYVVDPPASNSIWAHRFSLSGWVLFRGSGPGPYTTNDSINGQPVVVDDYIIQGGQGGNTGCLAGDLAPIGTVTHETGHLFGLPDLYDTSDQTEGIGRWDLMSSGNERLPYRPAHMSAWSLSFLGWINEIPVTTSQTVTAGPIELSDSAFVVPIAGTPDNEFFLLENRQPIGSDSMMYGPGLMVYHVDTVLINSRLMFNNVNAVNPHGLWVVEADGNHSLYCTFGSACWNRGDAGDPYPGTSNNTVLGFGTNPASTTNAGAYAGVVVDSIRQVAPFGAMAFRVTFRGVTTVKPSIAGAQVRVDSVATPLYQALLNAGDVHTIGVDSPQVSTDSLTQFLFRSWSDGGARSHAITGTLAGTTYVAQVAEAFLTRYAVSGGGSVNATRTIDATSGSFLAAGDSVTLTAVPASGQSFAGWIGDTTAANPALLLRLAHAWSVTALFTAQSDVVHQLLDGASALTAAEVQTLDQLGNKNGRFDLGDFVAWVDRNPGIPGLNMSKRGVAR